VLANACDRSRRFGRVPLRTLFKVFLYGLAALGCLVLILGICGYLVGHAFSDTVAEGDAFAARASHRECADETARRIRSCEGLTCEVIVSTFGTPA